MKNILSFILLVSLSLFAEEGVDGFEEEPINQEEVVKEKEPEIVEVKDTSGLSKEEVRQIADEEVEKKDVKASEIVKTIVERDSEGNVDISKFQKKWEDMSPTPKAYDWIQTKSGEWFKGEIKAMYNDKLEFDSDEIDLYDFKFKDIAQIKSFNTIDVNIDNAAIFSGIIRFKNDEMRIIQGDKTFKFNRDEIVSLALEGKREFNYWSGKITISLDVREGNKEQYDYVAKANIKRRTSDSNLNFDYLGRISSRSNEQTVNDHRLNQKYDVYITRHYYWTPLFSEYYQDLFINIQNQVTAGAGVGYELIDNSWAEWDVSGGPAYTFVEYISVVNGDRTASSLTLELMTHLELDLTKRVDFEYDYKLSYTNEKAGRYKHHMVATLENEITSWLDIDFTFVWDYILHPEKTSDGNLPLKSDFQFLVGFGVEF